MNNKWLLDMYDLIMKFIITFVVLYIFAIATTEMTLLVRIVLYCIAMWPVVHTIVFTHKWFKDMRKAKREEE